MTLRVRGEATAVADLPGKAMTTTDHVFKQYQTIVQEWAKAGLNFPKTVLLFDSSKASTDPETEATYAQFKQFARKDLGLDPENHVSQEVESEE
jgi:hypothetical protein